MRHTASFRFSLSCAILGLVLAVLGAALVSSRRSNEQAGLDRTLATTSGEKAALVETELERVRALALLTTRIPPFSEFYAEEGSQAAKIAAVAGPRGEINDALTYLWRLYPDRLVETGYVDRGGGEIARVVRGAETPAASLRKEVRRWPSFARAMTTRAGAATITAPFVSPTAGLDVVAATAPVAVDGRVRAYVELELATSAIRSVLSSDVERRVGVTLVSKAGTPLRGFGNQVDLQGITPRPGISNSGSWRFSIRQIPERSVADGPWYVVAAARAPSAWSFAMAPTQLAILALALLLLAAAVFAARQARADADAELAAEQRARAEAERRSRIDVLTGLFNRRHAMDTIEHELARSLRNDSAVGLLMFDVDRFKRINDSQGHAAGDAVLVEIGRRLRLGVREFDIVARTGGEEFCVIAPGMETEADVAELGDRLRLAIATRTVTLATGIALPVTISVGAALVYGGQGSAEHALDCADRALYAAKRRGRNRLCTFRELDQGDFRAEQPECLHLAEALALASDLREGAPVLHSAEVAELSAEVARRLGLPEDEILRVRLGGWLHDVGKINVPDNILTKPGSLTPEEWKIMRTHPVVGEELLRNFPELAIACDAVKYHHERWDGAGYPEGLAGGEIPLEARIVGATDAYSAMISQRPYGEPRTIEDAIEELRRCAGEHFDPQVVVALIEELEAAGASSRGAATAS